MRQRTQASVMLISGLALVGLAFTMIDRGWLKIAPWGPINHPVALLVATVGMILGFCAAHLRKKALASQDDPLNRHPDL